MLQATEQQLALVSRKVQRLETSVQSQIESLKSVRQQRGEALQQVEQLRSQLMAAEALADRLCTEHDDAQRLLKQSADEYAGAQLLQKKYQNAMQTLQGQCRAFVRLFGADRGSQPFVIADECTVNAVERKKSFVVDSVFDDSALDPSQLDAAVNTANTVADVLGGTNVGFITFGPSRSGKTSFMFGSSAVEAVIKGRMGAGGHGHGMRGGSISAPPEAQPDGMSVFERFVRQLFDNLEANEVTHFNIRCSFAELTQEQLVDLLSEYGGVSSVLGYRGGVAGAGIGQQSVADLRAVQVQSATDVLHLMQSGMARVGIGKTYRPMGHTLFTLVVENFNTKGHFRRATATFVDLCGVAFGTSSSNGSGVVAPEHQWVHKSITALCDVVSMLSAANQQHIQSTGQPLSVPLTDIPHRHNRLVQLLREFLGGNCKTTMLCCVNTRVNAPEEILSALSYAFYFKMVKNFPVPYDIPPELQKLNLQMNRFSEEDD